MSRQSTRVACQLRKERGESGTLEVDYIRTKKQLATFYNLWMATRKNYGFTTDMALVKHMNIDAGLACRLRNGEPISATHARAILDEYKRSK